MNKQFKLVIGIGLAVFLLAAVFTGVALAQGPVGGRGMMGGALGNQNFGPGTMMGGQGYGPGMMGGALGNQNFGPGTMMGGQGYGPGMMGGWGMMGSGGTYTGTMPYGCPMGGGAANPTNGQPITFDQAVAAVQQYLQGYNNPDLVLEEVMEFDNNFYALTKEKSTGNGAFELIVDRYAGYVHPEPGPNMMWNTRYGHMANGGIMGMMGRVMGRFWGQQSGPMTVTVEQARAAGQKWLDANQPGARLADDETQFYGYYTMDFLKDGKTAGMLSVNGYSGQVWYHTWHGDFISEREF